MSWKVFTRQDPWAEDIELVVVRDTMEEREFLVPPLAFKKFDPLMPIPTEEVNLFGPNGFDRMDARGFLQAMLDAAWDFGLRPASYADYTNELKAVRYHLEDMRKLAKVSDK